MPSNRLLLTTLFSSVLVAAACSGNESSPLEPTAQPAFSHGSGNSGGSRHGQWGDNRPSSCRALRARSESEDIGPSGGELRIGPHTLIVPPGALLQRTRITGRISSDSVNSVQFFPEGLRFLLPARIHLSFQNCRNVDLSTMKVVYTSDDLLQLLELIPSEVDQHKKSVVGLISHFSRYAIAY